MKNKFITPIVLSVMLLMMFAVGTYASAKDNDKDSARVKSETSINCPPGHMHAKGWLKNLLKPGNRVPCGVIGNDTTDPVISTVAVSGITDDRAVITWMTDENASSKIMYGTTTSYGSTANGGSWWMFWMHGFGTSHRVTLSGLDADTLYHFKVVSTDRSGNSSESSDMTFRTLVTSPEDTTGPAISSIVVSGISQTGATISWNTDEQATTRVRYGTTSSYGTTENVSGLSLAHSVDLSGLSPSTTYHYQLVSRDEEGNQTLSSDGMFTTLPTSSDVTDPEISGIAASSITSAGAIISWTTDENATTRVRYGTTSSYGSSVNNTNLVMSHGMALTGLTASTVYHYQVISVDAAGNSAESGDRTFSTLAAPDITAPVISSIGIDDLTGTSVNISWSTNEAATSKVYYGTANPLVVGSASSVSDSTMLSNHTLTLNGLSTGTTYYYVIESRDAVNNVGVSAQHSVTTEM